MHTELSPDIIDKALTTDTVAVRVMSKNLFPKKGQLVGVRLNLNVLKNTGVAVQTIHAATNRRSYQANKGFYNGEAIGYAGAVTLKNAFFNVEQNAREAIATGTQAKSPMASIDGMFVDAPTLIDVVDPLEIRFNPKEVHLFVDNEFKPIRRAEFVTIVGHRAFAWGDVEYHTAATMPKRAGDAPSKVVTDVIANTRVQTPAIVTAIAPDTELSFA